MTQEETLHWLALRMVPGLGPIGGLRLLEKLKSPQAIFRASATELEAAGLSPAQARNVASGCSFDDAVDQQQRMLNAGAELISYTDERYPQRLREIFDPPLMLFAKGRIELLKAHCVAVVGTRRPSPYGMAATERLSGDLAKAGLCIISGMARGIDTAAHKAVLAEDGDTIAVFGCGVDMLYPSENRKLYEVISQKGLLLSEFPMAAPAYPQNFPIRNRIVSGISWGVLVVEGAQHSGSGITARVAMDQGREVFAVPGNITSKDELGTESSHQTRGEAGAGMDGRDQRTARPGAPGIGQPRPAESFIGRAGRGAEPAAVTPEEPMKALAQKLLNHLQVDTPQQLESLVESFEGTSSSELIGALFDLEMSGFIRQLPGKNFVKVW